MHLSLWYVVIFCHQYNVCENSNVWRLLFWLVCLRVMWSELLMTSAISWHLWSSVYECHKVECAFISPVRTECGMFVMYRMPCCMLSVVL